MTPEWLVYVGPSAQSALKGPEYELAEVSRGTCVWQKMIYIYGVKERKLKLFEDEGQFLSQCEIEERSVEARA